MDKEIIAQFLNHYLSFATIVGGIAVLIFAVFVFYKIFKKDESKCLNVIAKNALLIGFIATLGGTFLTLFYSEYLRYAPCDLCWFQRIFLYPQIILFGFALYKKDYGISLYTFALSLVGLAIAIYHHMLQIGYNIYKPCSEAPFAVDCAKPSFIEFGFVTFPFMAVVLFGFLAVLSIVAMRFSRK